MNRRDLSIYVVSLTGAWFCAACSYSSVARLGPATGFETNPDDVRLFAGSGPKRPHRVLGLVSAQTDGEDTEDLDEELRDAAAELGADAVVNLRVYFGVGVWSAGLRGSGTAVTYR